MSRRCVPPALLLLALAAVLGARAAAGEVVLIGLSNRWVHCLRGSRAAGATGQPHRCCRIPHRLLQAVQCPACPQSGW